MSKYHVLSNALLDETGRLEFERWATKQLLSNLPLHGISCESNMEANDNFHFTRSYADLVLRVPDTVSYRDMIIASPLLQEAVKELREKSRSDLAKPYVKVEVQRDAAKVGFNVTVSLWYVNPDK
jgi:hypothetical protein